MSEKLKDIKETASDAVEIIRELGSPDVQESLEKIRDVAKAARDIIESIKSPDMVANIENVRKTVESIENTSARMEKITTELKNSGILDQATETIRSAKSTISSMGDPKNMGETIDAIKDMLRSISNLVDEIKVTITSSRKDGVIHDAEEAVRETRSAFSEHK
jgi:uncharacterized protein YjgD (DUF1641 family)